MGKSQFQIPNLQKLIDKYTNLSENEMREIARECCEAGQEILYNAMDDKIGAHTTEDGDPMTSSVEKSPLFDGGYVVSCKTGLLGLREHAFLGGGGNPKYRGLWFREFGGRGWRPPDPWFRPAVDESRSKIMKKWKQVLKDHGLE